MTDTAVDLSDLQRDVDKVCDALERLLEERATLLAAVQTARDVLRLPCDQHPTHSRIVLMQLDAALAFVEART